MQPRDQELEAFGAEALPGGLRDINDTRDNRQPPAARPQPPAAKAPVLGLIALASLWLKSNVKRG